MDTSEDSDAPTIGLEEEMFLVDAETLDCVPEMPERFERDARQHLGARFEREMISSMVELVTSSHSSTATLREETEEIRHQIARVAARHGLAMMACGTHPFADWSKQTITNSAAVTGRATVRRNRGSADRREPVAGLPPRHRCAFSGSSYAWRARCHAMLA
jgi:gamma-glutamyl:cysteine ligase YbdK (ATP-grasp superfamily)